MIDLPQKIVLFGVSKSGKSTLGDHFKDRFGYYSTAFADPLKQAAQAIFGFSTEDLWGPSHCREKMYKDIPLNGWCFECNMQCCALGAVDVEGEVDVSDHPDYWRCPGCGATFPGYATPRTALQTLGTGWGRKYATNLWANACFRRMTVGKSYVITDGRFLSERHAARENNACIVLLRRGLAESTSPHPSEAEIRELAERRPDLFHITLDNTTGSADENFDKLLTQIRHFEKNTRELDTTPYAVRWRAHEDRGELR